MSPMRETAVTRGPRTNACVDPRFFTALRRALLPGCVSPSLVPRGRGAAPGRCGSPVPTPLLRGFPASGASGR